MRRIVSVLMLLVLLSALLAACGQTAPGETDPGEPEVPEDVSPPPAESPEVMPSPEDAASPEASPEDEASPEGEASPEASPEDAASPEASPEDEAAGATGEMPDVSGLDLGTIKIASQSPLSGPQSALGIPIRNAAELAAEQLGSQMGLEVEVVPFDDQATESVGAANANTIAADQDILCVVGHLNSGVALAALPTYRDANLIMVSPANTNPRITEDFNDTAYRLVGRDDVQGVVAADFAADELGIQTAYVLHDQTAYGEGLANFFQRRAEELGLNVVGFAGTQETAVFDAILTPIQAANPDLVFFGGIYDRAGPLQQQMRERGIQAQFLGGDGLDSSELARLAGDAVEGVNYVTVSGPPSAYPAGAQFLEDYQEAYNAPAAYPAFQAYDSMRFCLTAIADAAQQAGGTPTREQVKEAAAEIESFQGVTGDITFNEEGDRVPATYYVFEVVSSDPNEWPNNEVVAEIEAGPPEE